MRLASLAVLLAALIAPAAADASSLVLLRPDGNVWLANPDGSGLYQVTTDGTPSDPYGAPSQADDGTIVTTRGSGDHELIYRLEQNGDVLSSFEPEVEFSLGLFDAQISPDGSKIAYWTGFFGNGSCDNGSTGTTACLSTHVTSSTGPDDRGVILAFRSSPSWMSPSRLVTGGNDLRLETYDLGGSQVTWVDADSPHEPELSADGRRLAATVGAGQDRIRLYETAGSPQTDSPPAQPTPICELQGAAGGQFDDPTWAPDGSALAWEEGDGNPNNQPSGNEGIWVWNIGNSGSLNNDCLAPNPAGPVIAGGSQPDWGPANVNPGPRGGGKPAFQGPLALSNRTFAAAPRGGSIASRAKVGTTVRYRLSEAATVRFTVERQSAGRRSGRRCVKPNKRNRRARRCARYVKVRGSFTHAGQAGSNSFKFTGRLRGRKLAPARYRLVAVAKDAAGNTSAPKRTSFRIVRR